MRDFTGSRSGSLAPSGGGNQIVVTGQSRNSLGIRSTHLSGLVCGRNTLERTGNQRTNGPVDGKGSEAKEERLEFPKKNGHGVKDYPAFSYSAGET